MPYKTGKLKGELTTPEIRKLIKTHNVLVSIKIPKGSKREDIIKLVEKNGYKVDHEKQALTPKVEMKRRPKVDMKKAEKVLPKPKTKLEKQKTKEEKEEKQMQKKKEERVKRKEIVSKALSQQKKQMDRKKQSKDKNISNNKMNKEDEVRPKEKVGRPKFDPKTIKVIEPKKKDKTFNFKDKEITLKDLLDYIDKEGYKISKSQVEGIKYLIDVRKLSKWRHGSCPYN